MVKILILDIETAPKLAYVWRFFKENIGAKQVVEHGHIMSYAAKWLGDDKIFYQENRKENDKKIIKSLVELLTEADIVVAHNGINFDLPQINGRALVHGIKPPSPYKILDTLKVARKEFGFPSNSLEYLAKVLGCKEKGGHKKYPGFDLWLECLKGNDEAWKEMKDYNILDVIVLEEVYLKMLPWSRYHPNVAVYEDTEESHCPKCNSTELHFRGYSYTSVGKYHRFQCQSCGGWGRSRQTLKETTTSRALMVNAIN